MVEVWTIPASEKELDPVVALRAYMSRRTAVFGPAEGVPFSLHQDGSIYTKVELNQDLALLLAKYPEMNTQRDKWSGHSFRAGLSTVLSIFGFPQGGYSEMGEVEI